MSWDPFDALIEWDERRMVRKQAKRFNERRVMSEHARARHDAEIERMEAEGIIRKEK